MDHAVGNPFQVFEEWFREASQIGLKEPNAMTLATVGADGRPSARIVLLKEFDEDGFVFYTNYESLKGRELAQNPNAALVFWWPPLERQIRVEGVTERVSKEQSEAYFKTRPLGSQLGAWASRQSEVIESREVLERRMNELERLSQTEPIQLPPYWGGYRLRPDRFEFWQGKPNRLHERRRYSLESKGVWKIDLLSP